MDVREVGVASVAWSLLRNNVYKQLIYMLKNTITGEGAVTYI